MISFSYSTRDGKVSCVCVVVVQVEVASVRQMDLEEVEKWKPLLVGCLVLITFFSPLF